jgi:C-terminal processing protease CtpA/Prc
LRGNIGGALDFAQYFFGLFQGANQYSFDLLHQGDYQVQRTSADKLAGLARYKEIAILTDNMTQSTAEVTTATFKRLHLAHVVGGTTRGWGSVENTYPLDTSIDPNTKYALLIVNSLTLRDDNQPIEGKGVDPDVNIADKNWRDKLSTYFTSPSLISAIEKAVSQPPLR